MFGRKKTMPEDMRMHYNAPSFSLRRGMIFNLYTKDEMKALQKEVANRIVLIHPGVNMLSAPREWARVFSSSFYVLIAGDKDDSYMKKLLSALEKEIYSPVVKRLSGATIVSTIEEADMVLSSLLKEENHEVITINNTKEVFS